MATKRIDRNTMFLDIARIVAERGTCGRAQVGAVIVKEGRIISLGYNGSPPGQPHCTEVGCEIELGGCIRTTHAEANAIAYAARAGISTDFTVMYCTHAPCYTCAKLMISAGIRACFYNIEYRDSRGIELLDRALVEVKAHGTS